MKKLLFAIFAHPDDEAFGPSGTLLMERKNGTAIHLITLTYGDAGTNPDNVSDLGAVREQEWRRAGALIGARSMTGLGYADGTLNNLAMLDIQEKLIHLVRQTLAGETDDVMVEFMTNDTNGISGHIDHIVAARSACYAFYTLKATDPRMTRIRLSCIPRSQFSHANTHWLYMEAGRDDQEIDERIDATAHREEVIAIMRAHHSQRHDGENHIAKRGELIGINHFMIKT